MSKIESADAAKVLVTGGAGYIGSHTCKALALRGYDPVAFDSLENGHKSAVKWGSLERGDLLDLERVRQVLGRHRPQAVIHFAAYAYVSESVADPASYYRNNVVGTLNLLDAMREEDLKRIVFSSTCATYGTPETIPIPEKATQKPINPYGRSKLMIERILADYAQAYDLDACSLRYFNAAGADPECEIGEAHEPEPHLIPNLLRASLGQGEELKVYGDDYPTPDGTCIRDFIHVTDLAEAHCQAVEYLRWSRGHHAFNLGSGRGYSVLEVIRTAQRVSGLEVPYRVEGRRPGDPPILVADAALAQRELEWKPKHSTIEQILGTALQWERSGAKKDIEAGRGARNAVNES